MARKSRKGVATLEQPKKDYMKIWRTALYIRLSVEFNGKRGDSLETQRQIMEAYAALCPDLEIVEVYTDNGITGRTFEREAFQRMLADVEAGKINCIMVKDSCGIIGPNQKGSKRLGFSGLVPSFLTEKRTNEKVEIGQAEMHSRFRDREE